MPRCYVPDPSGSRVTLSADEAHHLTQVLRLGAGAAVTAFDGLGHQWRATIASVARRDVVLELHESSPATPEPPVAVTLAVALLKGDQMGAVVRDATVLGASVVRPVLAAHSVVPGRAAGPGATGRWHRIAVAAAKQCGRAVVPRIEEPVSLATLCEAGLLGRLLICVEPSRSVEWQTPPELEPRPVAAVLCVGPEGGWADEELSMARAHGAWPVRLAPAIALTTLWSRWGWQ
jgi:16S rRNA (uracil1498-N3)-methyltransferase